MREIKFRSYGFGFGMRGPYELRNSAISESDPLNLLRWMQFTGLKDKNGKEIYEGDILAVESCKSPIEVQWTEGNGYCNTLESGFCIQDGIFGMEIVGNIHENPELLKK